VVSGAGDGCGVWGFGGEAVFLLEEGEGAVDGFGCGGAVGGVGGCGFGGARLGGGVGCCCCGLRGGDLGDGSDGAEVGVEDEVFDQVVWIVYVGVVWGAGVAAVVAGGACGGACGGAGFVEVPDGQFEGV
jgi:hypothetical protein